MTSFWFYSKGFFCWSNETSKCNTGEKGSQKGCDHLSEKDQGKDDDAAEQVVNKGILKSSNIWNEERVV